MQFEFQFKDSHTAPSISHSFQHHANKKRSHEDDANDDNRASKLNFCNRYRQTEDQPINYGYSSSPAPNKQSKSDQPLTFLTVYNCSSGIPMIVERLTVEKATESVMLKGLLSSIAPRLSFSILTCKGKHFSQRAPYPAVLLIRLNEKFLVHIDPRCPRGYAELQSTLTWLLSKTNAVMIYDMKQIKTTWRKFSFSIEMFPLMDLMVLDHYLQKSSGYRELRDSIARICNCFDEDRVIPHSDWSSRDLDSELLKKEARKSSDIIQFSDDMDEFFASESSIRKLNLIAEMMTATSKEQWVEPAAASSNENIDPLYRPLSTPRFSSPPVKKNNNPTTRSSYKHFNSAKTPPRTGPCQHPCFSSSEEEYGEEQKTNYDEEVTLNLPPHTITMTCPVAGLLKIFPTKYFAILQNLPEKLLTHDARDFALDLGRQPYIITKDGSRIPLTSSDDMNSGLIEESDLVEMANSLQYDFTQDGRTGIDGELHRISAFFSTTNEVLGFSIRVGRHFEGVGGALYDILTDTAHIDKSILILGPPGVGKTSLIRDMTRIIAVRDAVWIIDTSNEIAGPSNVPDPCVGMARRMMIPQGRTQHEIMLQCVQNHTPRVMIVDEIADQQEVFVCGTCKTRGVRLVGSAHGDLHGLVNNPQLNGLCGGLTSVTLGDSEASYRGNFRKTKTERKHAPTFDIVIEMLRDDFNSIRVVWNMTEAVDSIIAGRSYAAELRQRHIAADSRKVTVTARNIFVGRASLGTRSENKSQSNTPLKSNGASFSGQREPFQVEEMLD